MFAQILRKDRKRQRTHPSSGPTAHLAQYMWAQQGPWINGPTTLHPLMHLRGEKFGISPLSEVGFALLPSLSWVSPVCHYKTVSHRWNASVCSSAIASVCSVSSLDGTPTPTRLRPRRCPRLSRASWIFGGRSRLRLGLLGRHDLNGRVPRSGTLEAAPAAGGATWTGTSPAVARSRWLPRWAARPRRARQRGG